MSLIVKILIVIIGISALSIFLDDSNETTVSSQSLSGTDEIQVSIPLVSPIPSVTSVIQSQFNPSSSTYYPDDYYFGGYDSYENEYEDEKEKWPVSGSYDVEACNARTGRCYDLEADINDDTVETIYFPNGGHLDLDGAGLDDDGYAYGDSYTHSDGYDGDEWEVSCYDCSD